MALHQQSVGAGEHEPCYIELEGFEVGINPRLGSAGPLGCGCPRSASVQTRLQQEPGLAGASIGLLGSVGEGARVVHLKNIYTR